MKKFLIIISLPFFLTSCAEKLLPQKQTTVKIAISQDFVQGSEDIPLLQGMTKILDEGLGFDSESGSIMSSSYKSTIDLEEIKHFYKDTLPQMGWKLIKNNIATSGFKREGEHLEIEYVNRNGEDIVRFFISSSTN